MGVNAFDRVVITLREEAKAAGINVLELPMGTLLECVDRWMGLPDVTDWGANRADVGELARREAYRRESAEQNAKSNAFVIQAKARCFRPDAA